MSGRCWQAAEALRLLRRVRCTWTPLLRNRGSGDRRRNPLRFLPLEQVGAAGEELVECEKVVGDDLPVLLKKLVSCPHGDESQNLAGCGVADRRVVLGALEPAQHDGVATGYPADSQAWQAVCLGQHVKGQCLP